MMVEMTAEMMGISMVGRMVVQMVAMKAD